MHDEFERMGFSRLFGVSKSDLRDLIGNQDVEGCRASLKTLKVDVSAMSVLGQ